ncbi:MAG: PAS domain S-box protein [Candidatus Marinimicrobia bacterium]|nr:PAS domain S-box protein [Candidatus Neomarinimicrobiota bacterium]
MIDKIQLLENLPGIVYRCANDRDWTMLDISHGCIDLLEYQPEDLINNKTVSYGDLIEPKDRDMVFNEIQKAIDERKSYIIEYRIRTASGKIKWVWEQGIGIFSDDDELLSLEGYITELTETQILGKEEKYRLLIENIKDAIVISQFDRFIFFNDQFASMLGYSVSELTMMDYRDVYSVKGVEILRERSARRDRGENVPSQYDTVFRRKDGSEINVEANVSIIQYQGNTATFAVIRDISDRKKAELEIQKQKQYFEALYTSSPGAIATLDMQQNIVNVNPQFERLFGHTLQEIKGQNIDDLIVPQDLRKGAKEITSRIHLGGTAGVEAQRLRKDGTLVDVSINGAPIIVDGKQIGIIAVYVDITAIRAAEEEVQKQKQYFEALFANASDAIVTLDLSGNVVSINSYFERLFGYTRADIYGKNLDSFIVKEDNIEDATMITKKVQDGGIMHFERKRMRKDGMFIDVSVSGAPIIVNGKHIGALAIYRDISEQKRIEETLANERNLMRTLIDHLPDAIYVKNAACQKTLSNKADFQNMGASSESAVLGKTDFDFYPSELAALFQADDLKVIETGKPILNHEEKTTRPDRTIGWQISSKIPLKDSTGRIVGLVGIGHDITERKKAEEERERIIGELQTALRQVNTLSGLIPICANCKKIRDDKGYWSDVELYISKHSDAEFSHGLCNDCMKKLYPEQYDRLRAQGKLKGK